MAPDKDYEDYQRLLQLGRDLEVYAELEGSEIGEVCRCLIEMIHYTPYVSKPFAKALEKELKSQLKNLRDNTTIVDEVEKIERPIKRLEWNE